MRFELTGRHIKITAALRAVVDEQLDHALRKLNDSAVSVQIVLTQEKGRVLAEATLHVKGERFLHAEASGKDAETAVAAVLDKVDRQAQKVHSKWTEGKRRGGSLKVSDSPRGKARRALSVAEAEAPRGPRVIRMKRYPLKSMTVEDAAAVVGDTPNSFVVFHDQERDALSVVFRRPDGNVGLIEPDA